MLILQNTVGDGQVLEDEIRYVIKQGGVPVAALVAIDGLERGVRSRIPLACVALR